MAEPTSYWDKVRSASNIGASAGAANVPKAVTSANAAISGSSLDTGGKQDYWDKVRNISSGAPKSQGGILGGLGDIGSGILKAGVTALGVPAAVVASGLGETLDLAQGKGFSPKDFVKNATTSGYRLSSRFKIDTGLDWVDGIANIGMDIAGDPLSYVSFGAAGAAGRGGRTALSTRAATLNATAKAAGQAELFTVKEISDLGRLGQFAKLSPTQQAALEIQHGLRMQFGKNSLLFNPEGIAGKVSAKTSEVIGGAATRLRANIGDVVYSKSVRDFVLPKSFRALGDLGRRDTDLGSLINRLGEWSSSTSQTAKRGVALSKMLDAQAPLLKDIEASPYRSTVYQVADKTRVATDPAEQALADRIGLAFNEMQGVSNEAVGVFNAKRNAMAGTVQTIDNYGVKHSLSSSAKEWFNSLKGRTSKWASEIMDLTGMSKSEFIDGPDILRTRTLGVKDADGNLVVKRFLGEKLVDGSIDDINRVTEKVLGFKWFETDAAVLVQDYANSAATHIGRVAFVDRMLDFGPEVAEVLAYKILPSPQADAVMKLVRSLAKANATVARNIDTLDAQGLKVIDGSLRRAEKLMAEGVANVDAIRGARRVLQREVRNATKALKEAEALAVNATSTERQALETMLAPLRERVLHLNTAILADDAVTESSRLALAPMWRKLMPDVDVPENVDDIIAGIRNFNDAKVAELGTPASKGARTKAENVIADVQRNLDNTVKDITVGGVPAEAPKLDWVVLDEAANVGDTLTSPAANDSLTNWIRGNKYPDEWLADVGDESSQHYLKLQQDLVDGGVPDTVTIVRRGTPDARGEFQNGSMTEGWTGVGEGGYQYGVDEKIFVTEVPRKNIVGFGQVEEGEVFYKSAGSTTRELAKDEAPPSLRSAVVGTPYKRADAVKEAAKLNPKLAVAERKLEKLVASEVKAATADAKKLVTKTKAVLDNNTVLKAKADEWERVTRPVLQETIDSLRAAKVSAETFGATKFKSVTPRQFKAAVVNASPQIRGGQRVGLTLSGYDLADYKKMQLFLTADGLTGYAIKADGDLVSVFNVGRSGAGMDAVMDGVWRNGALKLDAYAQVSDEFPNGFLNTRYEEMGFEEVSRSPWDAQWAPDGWDEAVSGTPDVVYMKLKEGVKTDVDAFTRIKATQGDTGATGVSGAAPAAGQGLPDGVPSGVGTGTAEAGLGAPTVGTVGTPSAPSSVVSAETYTGPPPSLKSQGDAWAEQTSKLMEQIKDPRILTDKQRAVWDRVSTARAAGEVELAKNESKLGSARVLNDLLSPPEGVFKAGDIPKDFYGVLRAEVRDGYRAITGLGVQMPEEEYARLFGKLDALQTKAGQQQFFKIFRQYNQFFRVSAMLTPGFVVRNSLTGAVNNFVLGATVRDTAEGILFANVLRKDGLEAALKSLRNVSDEETLKAWEMVVGSGISQTNDIIQPIVDAAKSNRLMGSRPVKSWTSANHHTEVALRMTAALRGVKNGLDLDAGTQMVSRYHFNYGDLSKLDEYAKLFVPFWTFASRNIPLQFVNQLTRPSVYRAYERVREEYPVDPSVVLPEWLARRNPIGLGGNRVLNPDLPWIDMEDQVGQFSDPLRLLGQMYPQYRLIPELAGNRMFGTGIPFSSKTEPIRGPLDYPSALLGLLTGQTKMTADGLQMTSKGSYLLPQAFPTLATLQRLIPELGGQERYVGRAGSSRFGFLGVPIRTVSEEEQQRTLTGRELKIQAVIADLRKRGYVNDN